MKVWIDASVADPAIRVFGLDLVERHLQALRRLQPLRSLPTQVVIDLGSSTAAPSVPDALRSLFPIEIVRGEGATGQRLGRFLARSGQEAVLAVVGDALIDARLFADLDARSGSFVVTGEGEDASAAILRIEPADAANVPEQASSLAAVGAALIEKGARRLSPEEFNGFIRKLRRTMGFYLFTIRDEAKVRQVQKFLFWSNYKGSTDFFTRYVYPPLVWLMVRPLAAARVHPNTVTLVSILMTFAAIPFFANGYFLIGLLLSYGMSVLDSVDGKLARLTFTDSRLGNVLDHGLDLIHPPMWYVAWAWGLANGDTAHALISVLAPVSTVVYVLDRVVLKFYPKVFQRGLHTHARIDSMVRTFISRRNINLPIFTLGVFADFVVGGSSYATAAFYFIVFWQVVTLAYHAGRTWWIFFVEKAQNDPNRVSAT